jgi:hypothetical protein
MATSSKFESEFLEYLILWLIEQLATAQQVGSKQPDFQRRMLVLCCEDNFLPTS